MTAPQLNSCLHFIVRRVVTSSKVFLQSGKEITTRRRHANSMWTLIGVADDGDEASDLCHCSLNCVQSSSILLQDRLLHVWTSSFFRIVLPASPVFHNTTQSYLMY